MIFFNAKSLLVIFCLVIPLEGTIYRAVGLINRKTGKRVDLLGDVHCQETNNDQFKSLTQGLSESATKNTIKLLVEGCSKVSCDQIATHNEQAHELCEKFTKVCEKNKIKNDILGIKPSNEGLIKKVEKISSEKISVEKIDPRGKLIALKNCVALESNIRSVEKFLEKNSIVDSEFNILLSEIKKNNRDVLAGVDEALSRLLIEEEKNKLELSFDTLKSYLLKTIEERSISYIESCKKSSKGEEKKNWNLLCDTAIQKVKEINLSVKKKLSLSEMPFPATVLCASPSMDVKTTMSICKSGTPQTVVVIGYSHLVEVKAYLQCLLGWDVIYDAKLRDFSNVEHEDTEMTNYEKYMPLQKFDFLKREFFNKPSN